MVRLNCEALTNMTLLCAPYLSQGSRLLQIASAAAFAPQPGFAVYAATKSYVLSFSRALGAEWKKKESMSLQSVRDLWTQNFLSGAGNLKIRSKNDNGKGSKRSKTGTSGCETKKAVSIFGFWMRALYILVRIVPVSWILNVQTIGKSRREEQMKRIEKELQVIWIIRKSRNHPDCDLFSARSCHFTLGYVQTKTRSNLLTVVAILGCLPAAKALVGVITRFPYASVDQKLVHEVDTKAPHTTRVYDLVLTTREKIMPVECVVISNGTVFGYTDSKKVDLNVLSKHIRDMMTQNRLSYSTVKFYQDYKVFLSRIEGLESIAMVENAKINGEEEAQTRQLLLNLSM